MGGMLKAVETGYPQKEIAESAYQFQLQMDAKEQVMVGVNRYQDGDETPIPTLHVDYNAEKNQIERTRAFKAARPPHRWKAALEELRRTCREGRNVMPVLITGVEDGLTLGEVSDVYREVFGVYTDPGMF